VIREKGNVVLKGEAFEVNLTRNVKGTPKVYMPLQPTSACIIDLGKSRSLLFRFLSGFSTD